MSNQDPTFRDADTAFKDAIADGRLSANHNASNFAGYFMYMGTQNGRDLFKDFRTRKYI